MEHVCSKCGGSGPFPTTRRGNRCNACIAEYQRKNRPYNPEKDAPRQRTWRENNPGASAQVASRNYRKRKDSGKIGDWKRANRENINKQAREGYHRRKTRR